jgi:DNA mismatch repair protein MutS2
MLTRGYRMREAELMGRLANQVFDGVHDAVIALLALGLDLEFYLAALALRERAAGAGLEMSLPEFIEPKDVGETGTEFEALFNPLLLLEQKPPRPCDLKLGASALVVITGPNSGGKTRLLEAVGLTQLLAQAGMFVPARRARLRFRDGLFVSLIQEVTADQQEGRLGTELLRIRRMFERLDFNSLVILDELCSGTNPSEGEGIFELVVSLLAELEPQALITTHFLEFAARLAKERPVAGLGFLQVELDENNDPTYGFVPGVAPTSLAGRTAERLGVTREALEALVREKKREQRASLPPAPGKPPEDESERLRR